jgi:hypothetical protein
MIEAPLYNNSFGPSAVKNSCLRPEGEIGPQDFVARVRLVLPRC